MSDLTFSPEAEQKLKMAFKALNNFMVLMWRLGLGTFMRWRWFSGQIMVITHTGQKTGLRRRTPVNFVRHNGDIYCVSGFGKSSNWYRNIKHNPVVEIWLPDSWWLGTAEDITESPEAPQRLHEIMVASGFAAYLFGINPDRLNENELRGLLKTYRVIRIQRTFAVTGSGGPGDLAWVWPIAVLVLWLSRRKN